MLELYISPIGDLTIKLSDLLKKHGFYLAFFTNGITNGKTRFSYCFNMLSDRSVLKRLFTIRSEYL